MLVATALVGRADSSFNAAPLSRVVDPEWLSLDNAASQPELGGIVSTDDRLPKPELPFFWLGGLPIGSSQSTSGASSGVSVSMSYCLGSHVKFEVDDDHLVRWLSEEEAGQLPSPNPTELLRPPDTDR